MDVDTYQAAKARGDRTYVPTIMPEAYGAKGDGTTNDTAAITAALAALASTPGGGTLYCRGRYLVDPGLTISAPASGFVNWAAGAIRIVGDGAVKSRIISAGTGDLFTATSQNLVTLSDISIIGPGIGVAGSRAFFFNTTPRISMSRVLIRDFEVGASFYDCTSGVFDCLQVHYCGTGFQAGYNYDGMVFNASEFKWCGTGFQIGWSYGALGTGASQFINTLSFHSTLFAYCTTVGIRVIDKDAKGIRLAGCYWEGNPKDVEIGVSGRGDLVGPDMAFTDCLFSATVNPPIAVGVDVYTRATLTFDRCHTDGNNRYTIFVKFSEQAINQASCLIRDSRINAVTAALQVGSRNFNTTSEFRETINFGRKIANHLDTVNAPASPAPLIENRAYQASNRIVEAWGRSTIAGAVTNELVVQDSNGVLRLEGTTSAAIAATKVSSLPTAGADWRGCYVRIDGGAGSADLLYVCQKSAADTYSWKLLSTG